MKARTLEKSSSPTTLGAHVPANNGDHGQRTTDSGRPACPRFVVTLDSSLTSGETLARIPLAVTGKWVRDGNPFSITLEDLEEIVANFGKRRNGEINVDYDHASEMPEVAAGGPIPSAGRIVRLEEPKQIATPRLPSSVGHPLPRGEGKYQENKLHSPLPWGEGGGPEHRGEQCEPGEGARWILYGVYEPTDRARKLIESLEYRYISPAIKWAGRDKRTGKIAGTTLTSVALTNRPFLEELPQIRLSDPAYQLVEDGKIESSNHQAIRPLKKDAPSNGSITQSQNHKFLAKGGNMKHVKLSVEDGRVRIAHEDLNEDFFFDLDDLVASGAFPGSNPDRPATFSESGVIPYAQATKLLSEAEAQGKFISASEVFRAQAEQELTEAVRAGKILPRQRDDWRKIALSDLPTFRKLMGAQKPVVPLAPVGLAGTPPADVQDQVKFMAEQRMRERQITFGQALSDIGREQPDLVQQYRRAVSS